MSQGRYGLLCDRPLDDKDPNDTTGGRPRRVSCCSASFWRPDDAAWSENAEPTNPERHVGPFALPAGLGLAVHVTRKPCASGCSRARRKGESMTEGPLTTTAVLGYSSYDTSIKLRRQSVLRRRQCAAMRAATVFGCPRWSAGARADGIRRLACLAAGASRSGVPDRTCS